MDKKYNFKRSFYYEAEAAVKEKSISFILGTRKCGKTVCMHQMEDTFPNSIYIDMKADYDNDEQRKDLVLQILEAIRDSSDTIYLIDEASYMAFPDKEIARIASTFSEHGNSRTRVVFTGSQSSALEFWGHIACGGNAAFIHTGFLTYPEWLAYKGIPTVSEETYLDYILNIRKFYNCFDSTKEYLQGCLDETVISNRKTIEYVIGNSVDDLNAEMLLDVLYASLVNLHNHSKYETFSNPGHFADMLSYYFHNETSSIQYDKWKESISEILGGRYKTFKAMTASDCKSAMRFLVNCGLTTLTYVSDELAADPYIADKFLKETNEMYRKPEVFARFKLTINYPMFYLDLVENVLKEKMVSEVPRELLGSMVECHVRSLLPTAGGFEFRDSKGTEIDYVSTAEKAVEISVADKRIKDTNLGLLPKSYKKILLTRSMNEEVNGIERIPYYQFIYNNSTGKELVEELVKTKSKSKKTTLP